MSVFHSYEKVERLEKEECSGILIGNCYIFEKLDGANAQVYLDTETKQIAFASRNRILGIGDNLISGDSFRGFSNWVKNNNAPLTRFFEAYPHITLMGEWLVKHTLEYAPEAHNQFHVFDLYDSSRAHKKYIPIEGPDSKPWWDLMTLGFRFVPFDKMFVNPEMSDLVRILALPSIYGAPFREGIVIKNYDFFNKFGRQPYGKLLNENFREVKPRKKEVSEDAVELAIQVQYVTEARVRKICQKIVDTHYPGELRWQQLDMTYVPRVINMVFYDIITEDMNDILKRLKEPTINFRLLKRLVFDRAKEYYVKILKEGVPHEG